MSQELVKFLRDNSRDAKISIIRPLPAIVYPYRTGLPSGIPGVTDVYSDVNIYALALLIYYMKRSSYNNENK